MTRPFFTVLVPVFNQVRFLPEALDSLLAQTDPDWEAVVVDDGSTDGTPGIVAEYCRRDPRFRPIRKENGGVASALNAGLEASCGRWICWLSSDDLFDPRKLEIHRAAIAASSGARFFFTHFSDLDEAAGRVNEPPIERWHLEPKWFAVETLRNAVIWGNATCTDRSLFDEVGRFDPRYRYAQDVDMWLRILSRAGGRFIPDRTSVVRRHGGQMSHDLYGAGFLDYGGATLRFLGSHRLEELFPGQDLDDPRVAKECTQRVLSVAADPAAAMYGLGPNPFLVLRYLEWLFSAPGRRGAVSFIDAVADRTIRSAFGLPWRIAGAALGLPAPKIAIGPIDLEAWTSRAVRAAERNQKGSADGLRSFLALSGTVIERFEMRDSPVDCREILLITSSEVRSEALLEVGGLLSSLGYDVVIVSPGSPRLEFCDGVYIASVGGENSLRRFLRRLSPTDVLVVPPRFEEFMRGVVADRRVHWDVGAHMGRNTSSAASIAQDLLERVKAEPRRFESALSLSNLSRRARNAWRRIRDSSRPQNSTFES